jgi:hypothetical protein
MGFRNNVQADNAECNDEGGMEDVRDSERKAQEYTQYSSPSSEVRICFPYVFSAWFVVPCRGMYVKQMAQRCYIDHRRLSQLRND